MDLTTINESKPEISNYVKLNIGGSLFYTTITTLSNFNSKLRDMVLSEVARNSELSEGVCVCLCKILSTNKSECLC